MDKFLELLAKLTETRQKKITESNDIQSVAVKENRALTAEEQKSFDSLLEETRALDKQTNDINTNMELARAGAKVEVKSQLDLNGKELKDGMIDDEKKFGLGNNNSTPEFKSLLDECRYYQNEIRGVVQKNPGTEPYNVILDETEVRQQWREWLSNNSNEQELRKYYVEKRALVAGVDVKGGYLLPPTQFMAGFLESLNKEVKMRQWVRAVQVKRGASLGAMALDKSAGKATWGQELSRGPELDDIRFGQRTLTPVPIQVGIPISNELLATADVQMEQIVLAEMARVTGEGEEQAFISGNGAHRPLGFMIASDDGVPTSRDVSCGTGGKVSLTGLKKVKFNLNSRYWPGARWVMHQDIFEQIDALADSQGRPLLQPDITQGTNYRLLGLPVDISDFMPSATTNGAYVLTLANFARGYIIADATGMLFDRSREVYYQQKKTLFNLEKHTDGMPVLPECFSRGKITSS